MGDPNVSILSAIGTSSVEHLGTDYPKRYMDKPHRRNHDYPLGFTNSRARLKVFCMKRFLYMYASA